MNLLDEFWNKTGSLLKIYFEAFRCYEGYI